MPSGDLPQISNASYTSNSYTPWNLTTGSTGSMPTQWGGPEPEPDPEPDTLQQLRERIKARQGPRKSLLEFQPFQPHDDEAEISQHQQQIEQLTYMATQRRIVQIFIADPDTRVPLENSLIYQSEKPFLTDLNDQELFFEVPIKILLDTHNSKRITLVDKAASNISGKEVKLEPVKIRDLRMTIVDIAKF